jgi:hypothetical protein
MADREVTEALDEVPEIPELLEKLLLFALDEAKQKMDAGDDVVPFTSLLVRESVFIESHPANSTQEVFNLAEHTVEGARGATAYAFCYDGYIETDDGATDALIAEGGLPGEDEGYAVGVIYEAKTDENGKITEAKFENTPYFIGRSPNFMAKLKVAEEYSEEEIDEKYLEEAPEEADE